jgi:selT/selW/selH-like putative selenoprotein
MIPSGRGVFEVILNQNLIFSKKSLDRFPDDNEIIALFDSE